MIIRIQGEGQYDVDDTRAGDLNVLDGRLLTALEADDHTAFAPALAELVAAVRRWGTPVPETDLVTSEFVIPAADTDPARVRAMMADDGLIPG